MATERKRHGGPRPGAGRKCLDGKNISLKVTVVLPPGLVAYARQMGQGNLSAGVRLALEKYKEQSNVHSEQSND